MKEYFIIGAAVVGIGAIALINSRMSGSPFDSGAYDPLGLGLNNGNYADFITGVYDSDVGHSAAETPVAFGGGALPPAITGTQTDAANSSFWDNLLSSIQGTVAPPLAIGTSDGTLITTQPAPIPPPPTAPATPIQNGVVFAPLQTVTAFIARVSGH